MNRNIIYQNDIVHSLYYSAFHMTILPLQIFWKCGPRRKLFKKYVCYIFVHYRYIFQAQHLNKNKTNWMSWIALRMLPTVKSSFQLLFFFFQLSLRSCGLDLLHFFLVHCQSIQCILWLILNHFTKCRVLWDKTHTNIHTHSAFGLSYSRSRIYNTHIIRFI